MIEIINRFTGKVIFSHECDTIKKCVIAAIKSWANLREADLSGANLSWANLSWADLSGANLSGANLREADLIEANLSWADLSGADLSGANLREADLIEANLREADLIEANLSGANLSGADLSGANLDYSAIPFHCNSLKIISDKRLRVQMCFHFLSLIKNGIEVTDEEKQIYENLKKYANDFHRTDVERLK